MKVSCYQGNRTFTTGNAPIPTAGPGEALLRVRSVGICGTDLHIFQGHLDHRVPRGGVIGHEAFAEVVEAPATSGFRAGDRVVVEPLRFCGSCRACRMGAPYLCYRLAVLGVDLDGAMREYCAVPTERLLRVPDSLADDHAALVEPLAVATHDVRRADVKEGDAVLVMGGGPIGALIAMVVRQRGARVAVAELNPFRLELLEDLGFETIGPESKLDAFVEGWTNGEGVDVAFEVSGSQAAVRAITEVVRVWGTISVVAIHAGAVPVDLYQVFARELNLHGSRLYAREDWDAAIALAAKGEVELAPLVSRRVPLERLQAGMELALGGGPVMKVLVDLDA